MEKYRVDDRVAVLYSPGFGAGWSTWNPEYPDMLWDPGMVELILHSRREEAATYAALRWPEACLLGLENLQVYWLKQGTLFRIQEIDGNEEVEISDQCLWLQA